MATTHADSAVPSTTSAPAPTVDTPTAPTQAAPAPAVAAATTVPTTDSLALNSTPRINLRLPSPLASDLSPTAPTLQPPTLSFLRGSWTVTHSTLPMWRKARNVTITYTPIANSGSAGGHGHVGGTHLEDVVSYQALDESKGSKTSTVRGIDKPTITTETQNRGVGHHIDTAPPPTLPSGEELASLGYTWRGKGWLMIASSKWEILGYGEEEGGRNQWVVTYFAKTLFTPAGLDLYSRKGRLTQDTVDGIKGAIQRLGGDVGKLGKELFDVALDDEREA